MITREQMPMIQITEALTINNSPLPTDRCVIGRYKFPDIGGRRRFVIGAVSADNKWFSPMWGAVLSIQEIDGWAELPEAVAMQTKRRKGY